MESLKVLLVRDSAAGEPFAALLRTVGMQVTCVSFTDYRAHVQNIADFAIALRQSCAGEHPQSTDPKIGLFVASARAASYLPFGFQSPSPLFVATAGEATTSAFLKRMFKGTVDLHTVKNKSISAAVMRYFQEKQISHVLLPRSAEGRHEVIDELRDKNMSFQKYDLYEPFPAELTSLHDACLLQLSQGSFDVVLLFAPSAVKAFDAALRATLETSLAQLQRVTGLQIVSIGTTTAAAISDLGGSSVVATSPTPAAVRDAVLSLVPV